MEIGLQLYTMRDYLRTADEVRETLAKVAACGYTVVEPADMYGMTRGELAKVLAENGLRAVSTHTGIEALVNDVQQVIEGHKALGAAHCSISSMGRYYPHTRNGFAAFGEKLEEGAAALAKAGITLSFHNHRVEFLSLPGGTCGQTVIFDHAPSAYMQLDTGHCFAVSQNPVEWISRYADRMVTIHYKDMQFVDGVAQERAIGEGGIDWAAVTAAVKKSRCAYIIVEHEQFSRDAWDVLQTSYNNVRDMLK